MTTSRQAAANRRNSRKSCGPRSAAGRTTASRNALRHGLAARVHRSAPDTAIESLARALCGGDDHDAALLAQARVVAAEIMILRTITAQQTAVVERLYDETAIALAKGDNSRTLMQARFMQAWLADYEIEKQVPQLLEKYESESPAPLPEAQAELPTNALPDDLAHVMPSAADVDATTIVPVRLLAQLDEPYSPEQKQKALEIAREKVAQLGRDDHEALAEAMPDLLRLERYQQLAWGRLKRGLYTFMNLTLMRT